MPSRRSSYRRRRGSRRGGAQAVAPPSDMSLRHLLVIATPLDALVSWGGNLLAASGWCVVCKSGDEKGFYKTMSRLGVTDYYYGLQHLDTLAQQSWCTVVLHGADIQAEVGSRFHTSVPPVSKQTPLSTKMRRMKQVEMTTLQRTLEGARGPPLNIIPGTDDLVELQEADFTLRNILSVLRAGRSILYAPTTAKAAYTDRLRAILASPRGNADFFFVDARKQIPSLAEQYRYELDLTQPMLLRANNPNMFRLFALLDRVEDLKTVFHNNYQFLSRLRILELTPMRRGQVAGGLEEDEDSDNEAESVDQWELMYGALPVRGGSQHRRRRRASYRNRRTSKKVKRLTRRRQHGKRRRHAL